MTLSDPVCMAPAMDKCHTYALKGWGEGINVPFVLEFILFEKKKGDLTHPRNNFNI